MARSPYPTAAKKCGGTPLLPSPSLACHYHQLLPCRSDQAPKARSLLFGIWLQGCPFFTHVCRFPVIWSHSHIWVSFANALCACCWVALPLPEPLLTWHSAGALGMLGTLCIHWCVCVTHEINQLYCGVNIPPSLWEILVLVNETTVLRAEGTVACSVSLPCRSLLISQDTKLWLHLGKCRR